MEHKAFFRCAEIFRDHIIVVRIPFRVQRVYAVFAVVVGIDGKRCAAVVFAERDILFEHEVIALRRHDLYGVAAVGKTHYLPNVVAALYRRFGDRTVRYGDDQVIRRGGDCLVDLHVEGIIAGSLCKRNFQRVALLRRRKGVGVRAVFARRANNGCAVYFQRNVVICFGRERNGNGFAQHDILGQADRAARNFFAAVDGDGYGDIHPCGAEFQLAAFQNRRLIGAFAILFAEADAGKVLIEGEGIVAGSARACDLYPCVGVFLDENGDALVRRTVRVAGDHEVDAALLLCVFHRRGVVVKVPFALLAFEHRPVRIPNGEAEPVGRAVCKVEVERCRKGFGQKLVPTCPFEAEEAAQHKAVCQRGDLVVNGSVRPIDVLAPFQKDGVAPEHDLRVCLGRVEHPVFQSFVRYVVDRNVVQPRRKPFYGDGAVFARRRLDHGIAARKGEFGVFQRRIRADAVNGCLQRLLALGKRRKLGFHLDIARDRFLRDLDVRLLHVAFRLGAQRGVHIVADLIARNGDAVHAEFFERVAFVCLGNKGERAVFRRNAVPHPLLHGAVLRLLNGDVVPDGAAFVEVVPALRV